MSSQAAFPRSTSPRRVLYCESNTDGTIGGSHYCLLWLVENLDRAAFTPTVVFYDNHSLVPRFRSAAETIVMPRPHSIEWGTGRRSVLWLPVVMARRGLNLAKFAWRVVRFAGFLRANRIDLVHQNNSIKRHHDWMLAAFLVGVPCIAHERGVNRSYSLAERAFARRLALVIPVSRAIMGFLVAGGVSPDNIRVLYDGLDPARLEPVRSAATLRQEYNVRSDQPVVGIVGNIRVWKGQETVVRALLEVLKVHPDVVCFFVGSSTAGDTPYQNRLDELVAEAGIGKSVRFTGFQADPASYVNMMSVVIHASIEPEPFGMVVLEAMAQRKPIVGSRAGGVVEMVVDGQTGYTFAPGDAHDLAQRLIELLSDPARAARMGEAGYARLLDSFSIQQYMAGIHSAYEATLARTPIPPGVGIAYEAPSPADATG
jgi:glycosyltransferase involved in cell wall biosynthesis